MIDLHSHSNASDGSDDPATLVQRAAAAGVSSLALTDHDTQSGVPAAVAEASRLGIELIPGTELSLAWEGGAMHLVVLFLPPGVGPLQDRLAEIRVARHARNNEILEMLGSLGLPVGTDEVAAVAGGESVGRPHIAAAMVGRGYVESIAEAFDLYLGWGRPAYRPRWRLAPEEGIRLALESGGVPVLAHPHTLGLNNSEEVSSTLQRLREAGLRAMECYCPLYSPIEREGYAALAARFGLLPSGGSDYHGTFKPGIELGVGRGNLSVPAGLLDALRP
ncbi:MAG TPA: PHP domain-containing protein [Acidimicrobiia bacterium]|nr:PHP domain-containing protein [Acidimicrobiia bacterium]